MRLQEQKPHPKHFTAAAARQPGNYPPAETSEDCTEPSPATTICTASTMMMRQGTHHEGHIDVWAADEGAGEIRLLVGRNGPLSSLRRLNAGQPAAAALGELRLSGLRSVGEASPCRPGMFGHAPCQTALRITWSPSTSPF